ncbi:MAG: trypsin-like peptidase domain-containing protein [Rhodospirillales bacterium]|tara:strand:+ start:28323 stop:29408 length:1086 start_codon:yes stop_codon:yes gene_type:complete
MTTNFKKTIVGLAFLLGLAWIITPLARDLLLAEDSPRSIMPRGDLAGFERTAIQLFEAASPSVVYIYTESAVNDRIDRSTGNTGAGSGFLWDRAGYVVTNFHVVEGADRIAVQLGGGKAVKAKLVGAAPDYDLAVLLLGEVPPGLKSLPVGRSSDLRIGQAVFAIGNPFGLSRSLTTGVVSALNRHLPTASGREIHGVIQSDAAINPGNSGGPLLDSAGRLIGVNTAIISKSGGSSGVGFSVPVDIVNRVVPELIRTGKFPRPGIGIEIVDEQKIARMNIRGVVIARPLPGSEAARAGLRGIDQRNGRIGDIITHVDGRPVRNISEFAKALDALGIGTEMELTIIREGRERRLKIRVMDIS